MRFKHFFLWGGLFFLSGSVLFILWITRERPEEEIRRVAIEHLRNHRAAEQKIEGRDFSVGAVEVLSRNDEAAVVDLELKPAGTHTFYELRPQNGRWTVDRDLAEHFGKTAEEPSFSKGVSERVGRIEADRLRMTVTVYMEGKPFVYHLRRDVNDVLAVCESSFEIALPEGKSIQKRYIENFRYRQGQWVVDGQGQIFVKVR